MTGVVAHMGSGTPKHAMRGQLGAAANLSQAQVIMPRAVLETIDATIVEGKADLQRSLT